MSGKACLKRKINSGVVASLESGLSSAPAAAKAFRLDYAIGQQPEFTHEKEFYTFYLRYIIFPLIKA